MRSERGYNWQGHASGEGGPLLIADLEDFLYWGGAERNWTEEADYVVHCYGPLVRELPPKFQPQGAQEWHQNARLSTRSAAQEYVQELTAAAMTLQPTAVRRTQSPMNYEARLAELQAEVKKGGDAARVAREAWRIAWRDHCEQGIDFSMNDERILHVDVKPDTDYARGCDAMTDEVARIGFGAARQGVLWELEGSGTADVAMTADGTEFVLLRTWVDVEADEHAARAHVVNAPTEESLAEIQFQSGSVVVVWSTLRASDFVKDKDPGDWLRAAAGQEPVVQLSSLAEVPDVASLLRVKPGNYRVACGAHKAGNWSCRWARFTRLEKLAGRVGRSPGAGRGAE